MRLDQYLALHHEFTRNKAKQFIESWLVLVNSKIITKVSFETNESDSVTLTEDKRLHWVSRSAGKLDGFLDQLNENNQKILIKWTTCLDVWASTWGFTQILLDRWVLHIDAVDVGTNQLDPKIRNNDRVTSYEQTDIRTFQNQDKKYDIITCDVSFISITHILSDILRFADWYTNIFLLYKPQFEVGAENLRKTGVPKNLKVVENAMKKWEIFLESSSCEVLQKEKSSVIGEAGNEEWLYWIKKC